MKKSSEVARMKRAAVIDIGSNSAKFLVGQRREDGSVEVVREGTAVVRLGEGLHETGRLSADAMERNAEAAASFAEQAGALGAEEIRCVGTMALRSATNSGEFLALVKERCGLDVEIISGEEEARLSYLAVLSALPDTKEDVVIFDGGEGTAREMKRRLGQADLLNPSREPGKVLFLNSLQDEKKLELCEQLLNL